VLPKRVRPAASLSRIELTAIVACTVLHLVPVWLFQYFPTQDGPTHLENAFILTQYTAAGVPWRAYYTINTFLVPTWLDHLALAGLMKLAPAHTAEKVFLSGYLIGTVLAFSYCLRCLNRASVFCTVLIFPFLYNYLMHMGFYSFSYSFVPYLVLVGYFFRHRLSRPTAGRLALLFFLSLLVYLLHPVAWAMACAFAVPVFLNDARKAMKTPDRIRVIVRRLLPVTAILAVAIPAALFVSGNAKGGFGSPDVLPRLAGLLGLDFLVSFGYREYIFTLGLGALLLLLVLRGGRTLFLRGRYAGLLGALVLYAAMYLILPDYLFGGGWLTARLGLFTLLLFLLWLGANFRVWRFRAGLQIGAYAIATGLLVTHSLSDAELNEYLREYLSPAPLLAPGATLLPLSLAHAGKDPGGKDLAPARKICPFVHAAGHISVDRGVVEFSNYEASKGYFPLVYRRGLTPMSASGPSKAILRY
jgi:hypothetical protein